MCPGRISNGVVLLFSWISQLYVWINEFLKFYLFIRIATCNKHAQLHVTAFTEITKSMCAPGTNYFHQMQKLNNSGLVYCSWSAI